MKITLIGTTGSIASEERGYPAILINDDLLLDCGDGTTQKLVKMGLIEGIKVICITHLHCDHYTGLFTLLWHYWICKRKKSITIIGPVGLKEALETIIKLVNTPNTLPSCDINYIELKDSTDVQELDEIYKLKAVKTEHDPLTMAFRVEENDKSMVYTSDTGLSDHLIKITSDCDVLIHETTFPDEFSGLAHQLHHSTPLDAATLANQSNASILVLNHVSSAFQDKISKFKEQAEEKFKKEVIIAKDFMVLEI